MARGIVDVRSIDPTKKQLAATLRRAHNAANRQVGVRNPKLERDAAFWDRFAHDCLREPAGRRRSCKGGPQIPEVIAGWWTDPAGRKHVRVIGRTRGYSTRARGEGELRSLPPWWQVYPESVLSVRRADGGETFLACCRCGAVGSPESLGWMGDTCGPCFDRKADGGVPAGGFGHFPGWAAWQARVGFTGDGRLVGQASTNKFRIVNRADGSAVLGKSISGPLVAHAARPDAVLLGTSGGTLYRWAESENTPVKWLTQPRQYGQLVLDPGGQRAVVLTGEAGYTADLTAPEPRYERADRTQHGSAFRFTPAGDRILGITQAQELVAIDPVTLEATVLRANLFAGLTRYGSAREMAVAPDGSAVAVVRETYTASVAHAVRVVWVAGRDGGQEPGRTVDLPLPVWYRPHAAAFAPDGKHLATMDAQTGWVGFWKLPTGKSLGFVRAVPEDPGWRGGQVLWSPDGRALAVLCLGLFQGRGSTVAVWPWPVVMSAATPG